MIRRRCSLRGSRLQSLLHLAILIPLTTGQQITEVITSTVIAGAQQVCYNPDGTTAPDDIPCNSQNAVSTCCGNGWLSNVDNVCIQADASRRMSRGSCTDRSWQSGDCPLFCQGMLAIFNLFSPAKKKT